LLAVDSEIRQSAVSDPPPDPVLEAEELECIRGDRVLFRDLSFRVNPGTILLVEGPNGSGKTSLLRMACGLSQPSHGAVRWRGVNLRRDADVFHGELSYVGHLPGIKADLTPVENLRFDQSLAGGGPDLSDVLRRIGLGRFMDTPCRFLSAGQRRRVALARLQACPATVWILDEPFTAIDREGVTDLTRVMAEHARSGGLLLLTTHQTVDFDSCQVQTLRFGQ
jgi:heme exporter protein A